MPYSPQDFTQLLGLTGFSDNALATHFKLYEGYVTNTNKLVEKLASLEAGSPEANEIHRRFGWEFNGMRLHEYFFASLTKEQSQLDPNSPLAQKLTEQFGSTEKWLEEFKATAMTRGIGWAILYQDPNTGKLFNTWINEHDLGHLAGCNLILNIDVFEHAFMLDYGTNRADYIASFIQAIDWSVIEKRLSPTI